jgi:hypothetical protein
MAGGPGDTRTLPFTPRILTHHLRLLGLFRYPEKVATIIFEDLVRLSLTLARVVVSYAGTSCHLSNAEAPLQPWN